MANIKKKEPMYKTTMDLSAESRNQLEAICEQLKQSIKKVITRLLNEEFTKLNKNKGV